MIHYVRKIVEYWYRVETDNGDNETAVEIADEMDPEDAYRIDVLSLDMMSKENE